MDFIEEKNKICSKKAAIKSLIFPGYGHIYLKRTFRGIIFISTFLYTIYGIFFLFLPKFINLYNTLSINLLFKELQVVDEIKFPVFLIVIWIGAIIDSYLTAEFEIKKEIHSDNKKE